jgi:hypothetical protein
MGDVRRSVISKRSLTTVLGFLVLLTTILAAPARGHGNSNDSYPCSTGIQAIHNVNGSKHGSSAFPTGVNPPVPCTLYRSSVTTTNWSGGGSSGWYTHPNHVTYSLWSYWYLSQSYDNAYCYFVRAGAQGRVDAPGGGSTIYGEKFFYHGSQPSCWWG